VIEAGIGQRQAERIFPVDPPTHGISRLTVGQTLYVLQHRRQGEPPRCFGRLATAGEQGHKLAVVIDWTERVGDAQTVSAFWERGVSHAVGFFRHGGRLLWMQRHGGLDRS
jgi:hypothetical protein